MKKSDSKFEPFPLELANCTHCPRLVAHRTAVAEKKRRSYQHETYWGKPVPGVGDAKAQVLLLGLAPGAHGSNRTGRMFTGDGSGDFLFPALYEAGFSNQPGSSHQNDGLELDNVFITAAARCVPPANKPTRQERLNCLSWLAYDIAHLPNLALILALGSLAHDSYLLLLQAWGYKVVKAHHAFAHGAWHGMDDLDCVALDSVVGEARAKQVQLTPRNQLLKPLPMLDSYHVSIQNTNTGRLTKEMFAQILARAKSYVVSQ